MVIAVSKVSSAFGALLGFWFLCVFFNFLLHGWIPHCFPKHGWSKEPHEEGWTIRMIKAKALQCALLLPGNTCAEGNAVDRVFEWDGNALLNHNTSVSVRVTILFSKAFTPITHTVVELLKGRLLKVTAVCEEHVFVFLCVYTRTNAEERWSFWNILLETLLSCNAEDFLLVGGYFNCTE